MTGRRESTRRKLIFVAQHPIHYHTAIYRRASRDPDLDCDVYFMQKAWARDGYEPEFGQNIDWGIPITDGYAHRFFTNISPIPDGQGFLKFINPGLIWKILTGPRATIYVHGMNYFTHVACMIAAYMSGKPLVLRTITYDLNRPKGIKGLLRNWIYRVLFLMPSKFLYIGQHNAQFFRNHGVPERKLVYAPHIVDNEFFARKATGLDPPRSGIKARFGIGPEQKIIIFVGKVVERKQPMLLLRAFLDAGLEGEWALVVVGVGSELPALKRAASGSAATIVFTGYLNQIEVCDIYKIADIFVLPSINETWGLVVNEALNFGCAAIVSDKVGCAPDLLAGEAGLVFTMGDTGALTSALLRLARDPGLLARMRASARELVKGWDAEVYMAGLKRAIGPETGHQPERRKLIFVAQHPIHYHAAIYRRVSQDPELDCDVYFMQKAWARDGYEPEFGQSIDWGIPITDGYAHRFFTNVSLNPDGQGFLKFVNPGLIWKILTGPRATIYVHGMNYFTHMACMFAAFVSGKPLILRTITYDLNRPRGIKGLLRNWIYRALFLMPSKFLYIGQHNAQFFRNHGVPERKLVHAPHIVDNDFFARKACELAPAKSGIKARFGIRPEQQVIAFVGKMTRNKQCETLLKAFLEAGLGSRWAIVFAGAGTELDSVRKYAEIAPDRIFFTGFLNQREICEIYAITDILVLASLSETWGLVVNEALNFGCAVIASDKVGCAPDLVDGKTGLIFPAGDIGELTSALRRLASDPGFLAEMQTNARELITHWDADQYAFGLKTAIAGG